MSRFADMPGLSFTRKPEEVIPSGQVLLTRLDRKTQVMVAAATDIIGKLPAAGEAIHGVIRGGIDLSAILLAIVQEAGPIKAMTVSTLSYNRKNLDALIGLLDSRVVQNLTLLCSTYFRDNAQELWQKTLEEFRQRKQRAATARNHAKVICLETSSAKLVLEGSANLRANTGCEQFCLINDPALHDWHTGWINELVTRHEGENEASDEG